jgi:hypothetical protein
MSYCIQKCQTIGNVQKHIDTKPVSTLNERLPSLLVFEIPLQDGYTEDLVEII